MMILYALLFFALGFASARLWSKISSIMPVVVCGAHSVVVPDVAYRIV